MAARKVSLKEQVYTKIFNDLVVERFPLDEFLTEKQFMELYGVSKAPVREALIELCNEGILRSIPRLGYQIIPVTQKDIANCHLLFILFYDGAHGISEFLVSQTQKHKIFTCLLTLPLPKTIHLLAYLQLMIPCLLGHENIRLK